MKFICLFLFTYGFQTFAQEDSMRMEWFGNAKLGIFIHWGMYAVDGTTESWAFHNKEVPFETYMNQKNRFTAANYNPEVWANLIEESGAKYVVMTFQHHDGLALWDTKQKTPALPKDFWISVFPDRKYLTGKNALWNPKLPLSTVYQTPAKRDLISPLEKTIREKGLKFGAYYSLLDWVHPDYPKFLKNQEKYPFSDTSDQWNRYLKFMHAQLDEINTEFKPDLYWFDGDWEHSEREWRADQIDSIVHTSNPNAIFNGRLLSYSDYDTPEQNMPVIRPNKRYWELCLTSNNNWGYRPSDTNYKTPFEVLTIFTECLNMGGNLLLDIGPKADGTIPSEQEQLLKAIGRWTHKHQEAIYNTNAGLPYGHYAGNSTLSSDSTILYLFVPTAGLDSINGAYSVVHLKGLKNKIIDISILGSDIEPAHKIVGKISWSYVPGTVFIEVPAPSFDKEITVVKVELEGKLNLYRGQGGFH